MQTQAQNEPRICTPSFSCSGGTMYYQTTSCTTQVYQVCAHGCDGSSCRLASSTTSTVGATISSSLTDTSSTSTGTTEGNTNTNENANTNTTSISDILSSIVSGDLFGSTDVGTSVPLTLNPDTNSADILQPTYEDPVFGTLASGTITSVQPVGGKPTFISPDLSASYVPTGRQSIVASVLEGMRSTLVRALDFLRSLSR